ncbi:hypothetical protein D0T84_10240 [Dysgonomonas sp. 521]|uniref:hypothetical protein n=1 Tax=Dysgonomonas sp. 521 TaxID=2302932 RepID=UPI0013D75C18|nr:hypothetical protein [Dysgonomonas sp. 521]NDV95298.1 hypothetical protein [Dysgonomonas sp. 521]
MRGKLLLKQIEQACLENRLDYRDLIDLGLDMQRKAIDEQSERVQRICKQFEKQKTKHNDPFENVKVGQIGRIIKTNWN